MSEPLLRVDNLQTHFFADSGVVRAVEEPALARHVGVGAVREVVLAPREDDVGAARGLVGEGDGAAGRLGVWRSRRPGGPTREERGEREHRERQPSHRSIVR